MASFSRQPGTGGTAVRPTAGNMFPRPRQPQQSQQAGGGSIDDALGAMTAQLGGPEAVRKPPALPGMGVAVGGAAMPPPNTTTKPVSVGGRKPQFGQPAQIDGEAPPVPIPAPFPSAGNNGTTDAMPPDVIDYNYNKPMRPGSEFGPPPPVIGGEPEVPFPGSGPIMRPGSEFHTSPVYPNINGAGMAGMAYTPGGDPFGRGGKLPLPGMEAPQSAPDGMALGMDAIPLPMSTPMSAQQAHPALMAAGRGGGQRGVYGRGTTPPSGAHARRQALQQRQRVMLQQAGLGAMSSKLPGKL